MMKFKALLLFASTLAVAACGQKADTSANADMNTSDTSMTNMDAGNLAANDAASVSPTSAQGFVNAAATSDKFEIETSKLASAAGASSATKAFATKMIDAHTASTAKLKSTLSGMNPPVTPVDTLTAEQQSTLDNLKTLKGADFDAAYKTAQVDAHTKTLDALKNYSASGDTPALKTFADGLIATVTAHLNMAKGLK
jgi:putative membrane protein